MKALPLVATGLSLLVCPHLPAQAPAPKADAPPKAPAPAEGKAASGGAAAAPVNLPGLEKLSEEKRKALVAGMGEVSNFLRGVRWQEALEKLNQMEDAAGENHYIENLRGAVYTRMRNFDKAREHFTKALELTKDMETEKFHPRFNIAELDFVTKKWESAEKAFLALLKDPGKPGPANDALINFKLYICYLQQKKEEPAGVLFAAFDQYDHNSPAWYYAQAVQHFIKDDKDGGNEWLEQSRRIYPKEINEVYNDSLVEMGWLETLQ